MLAQVCFSCMSHAFPNLMMWVNDLIVEVLMYHISSSAPLVMTKYSLILKISV